MTHIASNRPHAGAAPHHADGDVAPRLHILALLPEMASARRCLHLAWAAAEIVGAELEAFHVKVDPRKLYTAPEEISLQMLREPREGSAADRAHAVRAAFDSWLVNLPLLSRQRVSWREAVGSEEDNVERESKQADLLVVPAPHNLDSSDANHAAFRRSHRPLLYVPDRVRYAPFIDHIAIAWKATPQAHRAVLGAGPWLRRARKVTAIMVAKSDARSHWNDAQRLLNALEVTAEPVVVPASGLSIGERLLRTTRELQADSLVLGAYRRHEVIEWLLPSTTRHILRHTEFPLFLAH